VYKHNELGESEGGGRRWRSEGEGGGVREGEGGGVREKVEE